jgi:hypothetical protein
MMATWFAFDLSQSRRAAYDVWLVIPLNWLSRDLVSYVFSHSFAHFSSLFKASRKIIRKPFEAFQLFFFSFIHFAASETKQKLIAFVHVAGNAFLVRPSPAPQLYEWWNFARFGELWWLKPYVRPLIDKPGMYWQYLRSALMSCLRLRLVGHLSEINLWIYDCAACKHTSLRTDWLAGARLFLRFQTCREDLIFSHSLKRLIEECWSHLQTASNH